MSRRPEHVAAELLRPAVGDEPIALDDAEHLQAETAVMEALRLRRSARARSEARQRWVRPTLWAGALAAGLALAMGGVWLVGKKAPGAQMLEAEQATIAEVRQVKRGDAITAGDVLSVPSGGRASFGFPEGTTITLAERSAVEINRVDRQRRFTLQRGHLTASVKKLKGDERFEVVTASATVSVRGTRFDVTVEEPSPSCSAGATIVSVEEGLVAVTSGTKENLVHPGEQLRVGCEAEEASETDANDVAEPRQEPNRPSARPLPSSSLARMNARYAKAMALKRTGQLAAAAATLRELRQTFPSGPLDEAAAVEELRLWEQVDLKRARAAAREYLRDYPSGYAKDIARQLLVEP